MKSRILIVDDEATIRASLQESLLNEGYEAETAETGEEALARCHGSEYDLVITDLRLPGVSGLEILQALRNQGKQTPVIMMTAYGDVDTAVSAMRLGAYDFIPKPFKLARSRSRSAPRCARPWSARMRPSPPTRPTSRSARLRGRPVPSRTDATCR